MENKADDKMEKKEEAYDFTGKFALQALKNMKQ